MAVCAFIYILIHCKNHLFAGKVKCFLSEYHCWMGKRVEAFGRMV